MADRLVEILPRNWGLGSAVLHVLRWALVLSVMQFAGGWCANCLAATVVIANRTTHAVTFQLGDDQHNLPPGDVRGLRLTAAKLVRFPGSLRPYYLVEPNAAYYLGPASSGRIDLVRIGFSGDAAATSVFDSDLLDAAPNAKNPSPLLTIPVKILVDEEEAATRELWEARLRRRVAEASRIFERHCLVKFDVTSVATWHSNNEIIDFERSLAEFEANVPPAPARLAIGFTSQYRVMRERTHLGGTRGPLHSHLLVREWSNHINEPERLEVLVHELGHFLGAVHSPEPDSVMRPILADRQARANTFRIGFDPVNTLAMNLVAQSFTAGRVGKFFELPLATQLELRKVYSEVAAANPHDKTPGQYVQLLDRAGLEPLAKSTRLVLLAVGMAADRNARLGQAADPAAVAKVLQPATGDELFDLYVRTAAQVALHTTNPQARRGFLIGLGAAVDRTSLLEQHRLMGPLLAKSQTSAERQARLKLLGVPTLRGKHEQARHFVLAAALTAVVGPHEAERACLALQLGTSTNPGSFNAATYQAALAGIVFAQRVLTGQISLDNIAKSFQAADWVAEVAPPAMAADNSIRRDHNNDRTFSAGEFAAEFGGVSDRRFREFRRQLGEHLKQARAFSQ